MNTRARAFIEQTKEVALIEARLDAHKHGRGFVLRRMATPAARESLEAAASAFASRPPGGLPMEVEAFDAARRHEVGQWWAYSFADTEPQNGAHECFESADSVRELMETAELEAMDDAGEFTPPLEEYYSPTVVESYHKARARTLN